MKSTMFSTFAILAISSTTVFAQLSSMRATIPGSLQQCEQTTLFLFDTSNTRPITLVLLPSSTTPSSSSLTLREAQAIGPLQVLEGVTTPDAASHPWQISIAENVEFTTWGFLPDGTGKNLNLNRKVMAPLPNQGSTCKAATVEDANRAGTKNSGGRKANTGTIIVGVAPEQLASSTEKGEGSSVLMIMAPTTAVQAVSPIASATAAVASDVQDTVATTPAEAEPSQTVVAAEKSESSNSASGQVVMKWLVGGLGLMSVAVVGW